MGTTQCPKHLSKQPVEASLRSNVLFKIFLYSIHRLEGYEYIVNCYEFQNRIAYDPLGLQQRCFYLVTCVLTKSVHGVSVRALA